MKTRILFVDDEPLVLQALQRMLRSMRREWDTAYVGSGPEALERLQNETFDVIVSDMRMPGMDGATLLNEVMRRHPRIARFILSGHADRDMVMRCIGATHQYLSKPCELETLRATIQRACSARHSLAVDNLQQLVGRIEHLPSLPSLYIEILECLRRPEVEMEEIVAVIARDVAMTAKLLKLVNSAFFGLASHMASVRDAVHYLGIDTIQTLVLTTHAFDQFRATGVPLSHIEDLWSHSLEVANTAQCIARDETDNRKLADEAFAGGMLHDVGKLILICNFTAEHAEARRLAAEERIHLHEAETRVLKANHAEVGGYLLGLWGLSPGVVEAIRYHHAPKQSLQSAFSPLTAVHVANALVQRRRPRSSNRSDILDRDYLGTIGCDPRIQAWHNLQPGTALAR